PRPAFAQGAPAAPVVAAGCPPTGATAPTSRPGVARFANARAARLHCAHPAAGRVAGVAVAQRAVRHSSAVAGRLNASAVHPGVDAGSARGPQVVGDAQAALDLPPRAVDALQAGRANARSTHPNDCVRTWRPVRCPHAVIGLRAVGNPVAVLRADGDSNVGLATNSRLPVAGPAA